MSKINEILKVHSEEDLKNKTTDEIKLMMLKGWRALDKLPLTTIQKSTLENKIEICRTVLHQRLYNNDY